MYAKFKTQTESSSNIKGSAKTSDMNLFCYLYMFSI